MFDISKFPDKVKIEVTREDLIAFAETLRGDSDAQTEKKDRKFIKIDEAADLLNLSKATVYQLTSKKQIPFYKLNNRLYFKAEELLEWMEAGKQEVEPDTDEEVEDLIEDLRNRRNNFK